MSPKNSRDCRGCTEFYRRLATKEEEQKEERGTALDHWCVWWRWRAGFQLDRVYAHHTNHCCLHHRLRHRCVLPQAKETACLIDFSLIPEDYRINSVAELRFVARTRMSTPRIVHLNFAGTRTCLLIAFWASCGRRTTRATVYVVVLVVARYKVQHFTRAAAVAVEDD